MEFEKINVGDNVKIFATGDIRSIIAIDYDYDRYWIQGENTWEHYKREDIEIVNDSSDDILNSVSFHILKIQLMSAINYSIDSKNEDSFNTYSKEYNNLIKSIDNS